MKLDNNKKTVAIMLPNLLGNVVNWKEVCKIANKFNLKIIEDSADTIGYLYKGKNFMVKELVINPNSSLSMQRHKYRSETWNLVSGNAQILAKWGTGDPQDGPAVWELHPNNPVDIGVGYWHKGRNITDHPAHIIEIWKGPTDKLTEDDIERWEDDTSN